MNKLLSDSGFSDKKLVIQQGGTYTGQDDKEDKLTEYKAKKIRHLILRKEQFICWLMVWNRCYSALMSSILAMMEQFITGSQ